MAIHAILMDLDGTLVDSNEAHIDAWHEAFQAAGFDIAPDRIRPEIGKGGDHLVKDVLGEEEDRRVGSELRKAHDDNFLRIAQDRRLRLFPGTIELLETLRRRWLKPAIVTSSKRSMIDATFDAVGMKLDGYVDAIINADDAARSKPSPDLMHAALKKLALTPDTCLFVGDTVHDGKAALKADIAFVGLLCGRCASESDLSIAGAVSVWKDPRHLKENLDQVIATAATVQAG